MFESPRGRAISRSERVDLSSAAPFPRTGVYMNSDEYRMAPSKPERAWTVAELAHLSAMSRPSFARNFERALGQSPMQYLPTGG